MSALTDTFTSIANAIRAKLGVSTTYTPAQMASAIASIPKAVLQTKTQTVTPSANWSGTNTNNATISPDSGYDGMSQVNVNVPMLRDNTLMTADTVDTPGTVYNGNTSQSNSQKLLRMHPTKDGMSYTGSYLYMQPNSYLGNALASDVLSGKTFSSSNGIQLTGTASGGITPSGTKSDTYTSNGTFTTDVTNYANHSVTVNVPVQKTLLWTNPNPNSDFSAQNVYLSGPANQGALLIRFKTSTNYEYYAILARTGPVTGNFAYSVAYVDYIRYRYLECDHARDSSNPYISIGDSCYFYNGYKLTYNGDLIPLEIYSTPKISF